MRNRLFGACVALALGLAPALGQGTVNPPPPEVFAQASTVLYPEPAVLAPFRPETIETDSPIATPGVDTTFRMISAAVSILPCSGDYSDCSRRTVYLLPGTELAHSFGTIFHELDGTDNHEEISVRVRAPLSVTAGGAYHTSYEASQTFATSNPDFRYPYHVRVSCDFSWWVTNLYACRYDEAIYDGTFHRTWSFETDLAQPTPLVGSLFAAYGSAAVWTGCDGCPTQPPYGRLDVSIGAIYSSDPVEAYTLTGNVAGEDFVALAGATISVTGAALGSAVTEANGRYIFTGVPNGTYTVTALKRGYTFEPPARVVSLPPSADDLDFTGTPELSTLSGRVLISATGAPMPNVKVNASNSSPAFTDANGYYTFTNLLPDDYVVRVDPTGDAYAFAPRSITITLPPSAAGVNFTASPNYTVTGRIVFSDGTGTPKVTLRAGDRSLQTGVSGYFTLTGMESGAYTVTPSKNGYSFTPESLLVTGPTDANDLVITATSHFSWTLLYYLDADNDLTQTIKSKRTLIEQEARVNPGAQVVILYAERGGATLIALPDDLVVAQPGLNIGLGATLRNFIVWARSRYPAEHSALILADHGNGLTGAMYSDSYKSFITVPQLGQALAEATENGARKLDVLYMDACLMAMLEDAYQWRDYVNYYVASENLGWAWHGGGDYGKPLRDLKSENDQSTPAKLARHFGEWYAGQCNLNRYPCTVSVADLSMLPALITATDGLAYTLNGQMSAISATLIQVLSDVQRFDSNGNKRLDGADAYIDLLDFARRMRDASGDLAIQTAAQEVIFAQGQYVLYNFPQSGAWLTYAMALTNSNGVSIFFPPTKSSFYNANNYAFAVGATWNLTPAASLAATEAVSATQWGPLLVSYFQATQPNGSDDPNPPPLVALQLVYALRLPIVLRGSG